MWCTVVRCNVVRVLVDWYPVLDGTTPCVCAEARLGCSPQGVGTCTRFAGATPAQVRILALSISMPCNAGAWERKRCLEVGYTLRHDGSCSCCSLGLSPLCTFGAFSQRLCRTCGALACPREPSCTLAGPADYSAIIHVCSEGMAAACNVRHTSRHGIVLRGVASGVAWCVETNV